MFLHNSQKQDKILDLFIFHNLLMFILYNRNLQGTHYIF